METSSANVHDAARINRAFLAATQRKVLVVTKLFQLKHERLTHRGTTRNGAVARPSGNDSARRAGVYELLWHGRAWENSGGIFRHARFTLGKQGWTNL